MTADQTKEDIRYIKEMIDKSKRSTAESGFMLILWAVVPILAIVGMYLLINQKKYELIWINWMVNIGLGVLISILYNIRMSKRSKISTYSQMAAMHLWVGCGIGFILLGFVLPLLQVYSRDAIPVVLAIIAGIAMFTTGGIAEWNLLKVCGIIWWVGSLIMIFVHPNVRPLVFIPLILVGYLMPGLILNAHYRKGAKQNG